MTTDYNPDPASEPVAFPPNPTHLPATPALPDTEGAQKVDRVDQIANHLAHKGAKTEQAFDTQNSQLFSK